MLVIYRVLFFFATALLVTGCHFGKLRCVVCRRYISVDTVRYADGQPRSIQWDVGKGAGIHRNFKHREVTQEFDAQGTLRVEYRRQYINIYKNLSRIMLKEQRITYGQDSIRREIRRYRRGRLVKVVQRLR